MFSFFFQHPLLGSSGAFSLLTTNLLDPLPLLTLLAPDHLLDLISKDPAGQKTIQSLGPFPLTLHFNLGGKVLQVNTGGCLIDLLTASAAGTDKLLDDVLLEDA